MGVIVLVISDHSAPLYNVVTYNVQVKALKARDPSGEYSFPRQ
jgi:hypothetical protein